MKRSAKPGSIRYVTIGLLIVAMSGGWNVFGAEKPLSNSDVVKLSSLGLGDDAIIAKIRQAEEVDFHLETDDLIKLKSAGVSGKIIAAMIDRTSAAESRHKYVAGPNGVEVVATSASPVKLITSTTTIPLTSLIGDESSTYVYVTMLFWLNFPGLHATNRTPDRKLSFLIETDRDPRSRYYVVRLDVNDKDGDRSVKIGRSGAFSFKSGGSPDSDWTFPFEATEEHKGLWKLSLKTSLKPGEYGVLTAQTHELYDFGVD